MPGAKCEIGYSHNPSDGATTFGCEPHDCETIFRVGKTKDKPPKPEYTPVTPVCHLVTEVEFKDGKFAPVDKDPGPKCVCLVEGGCKYTPEVDPANPKKLTKAGCSGECPQYLKKLPEKDKKPGEKDVVGRRCALLIDHQQNHKIICACIILT